MPAHRIRLRRPWLRYSDDSSTPVRVDVPDPAAGHQTAPKRVRYQRKFNRPTRLTADASVILQIASIQAAHAIVRLNESTVWESTSAGASQVSFPIEIEIRDNLAPANLVEVELRDDPDETPSHTPLKIDGEVALLIEDH